jgi:phage terminase large subunit GpA-like protein
MRSATLDPTAAANWRERRRVVVRHAFEPRPHIAGSEWADAHGYLPADSPEPGRFRVSRVPYLREPLDAVCDPHVEHVVAMKGSQVGWTVSVLGMAAGYFIHQRPQPILVYQPTEDDARAFARDKFAGIIGESPVLRALIGEEGGRDGRNTTLRKVYPAGHLDVLWASTTRAFRLRSAGVIFADEVDEYPTTEQGDPIRLIRSRLTAYRHPTFVESSTPTLKGDSRIETAYERSDRRRFHVACPHCDHGQPLVWGGPEEDRGLKWDAELVEGRKVHVPGTVAYLCEHCHVLIEERHKPRMIAEGLWVAENPGAAARGYHIPQLIAPFQGTRWEGLVGKWDEVHDQPEELQTFINHVLAETWEERDLTVQVGRLASRAEAYPAEVPHGVAVLVASVDVQHDRLELAVKGYGAGEESWLIGHHRLWGDTALPDAEVWKQLEHELGRAYRCESGRTSRIRAAFIDAGDQPTTVQRFVRGKEARGIYAVMGTDGRQRQQLRRSNRPNKQGVRLWTVDTWAFKRMVSHRLQVEKPGPRFMHFCAPSRTGADAEYFAQFGAMTWRRRRVGGRMTLAPHQLRERDEAIDLEVYALAALHALGDPVVRRLGELAEELSRPPDEDPPKSERPGPPPRRRGGWVQSWRD